MRQSTELPLTHEQIAGHLGTAREVVSRMLKYFESEGAVELVPGRPAAYGRRTAGKLGAGTQAASVTRSRNDDAAG